MLPPDMIKSMRTSYKNFEALLSTTIRENRGLKSVAKTMFDIDLAEVKVAKEKKLNKELSSDEEIELLENEIKELRMHQDPQKIVGENELEKHLKEGWKFVSVLPSKKILIKKDS
jgi:hypothetical protein